jgi:hypothetical protein
MPSPCVGRRTSRRFDRLDALGLLRDARARRWQCAVDDEVAVERVNCVPAGSDRRRRRQRRFPADAAGAAHRNVVGDAVVEGEAHNPATIDRLGTEFSGDRGALVTNALGPSRRVDRPGIGGACLDRTRGAHRGGRRSQPPLPAPVPRPRRSCPHADLFFASRMILTRSSDSSRCSSSTVGKLGRSVSKNSPIRSSSSCHSSR